MYSSWDMFNKMIENHGRYGFSKSDLTKAGGTMWVDHIHPTSRVHAFIAEDLDEFLKKYPDSGRPDKA